MSQPDPRQSSNSQSRRPRTVVNGQGIDVAQVQTGQVQAAWRGCGPLGCIFAAVITLITVGALAIAAYAILTSLGVSLGPLSNMVNSLAGGPEMRPISGDASRFDPLLSLSEARELAGDDVQVASIKAHYVRSDGTMDLNATYTPAPYVIYKFLREVPRPENAAPIGAGGATAGPWYQPIEINAFKPGQRRRQTTTSGGSSVTIDYVNQGMTRTVADPTSNVSDPPTSDPICKFTDLWAVALEQDAPTDAVAVIEYNEDGYRFYISGVISLKFDQECQLID